LYLWHSTTLNNIAICTFPLFSKMNLPRISRKSAPTSILSWILLYTMLAQWLPTPTASFLAPFSSRGLTSRNRHLICVSKRTLPAAGHVRWSGAVQSSNSKENSYICDYSLCLNPLSSPAPPPPNNKKQLQRHTNIDRAIDIRLKPTTESMLLIKSQTCTKMEIRTVKPFEKRKRWKNLLWQQKTKLQPQVAVAVLVVVVRQKLPFLPTNTS